MDPAATTSSNSEFYSEWAERNPMDPNPPRDRIRMQSFDTIWSTASHRAYHIQTRLTGPEIDLHVYSRRDLYDLRISVILIIAAKSIRIGSMVGHYIHNTGFSVLRVLLSHQTTRATLSKNLRKGEYGWLSFIQVLMVGDVERFGYTGRNGARTWTSSPLSHREFQ